MFRNFLIALVLTFTFVGVSFAQYIDVFDNHTNFEAINYLSEKKIIQGYEDKSFKPDQKVTRSEAVKMILGVVNRQADVNAVKLNFNDITADAWYVPYLKQGVKLMFVDGYEDKSFRPNNFVNKAEFLKMFFSASGHPVSSIAARSANIYADVPANLWFSVYVNQAKNMKLVSLESDGRFHADWALTRGQIAEIIYRYLYIKEKKLPMFDPSLNWNVYDQASLFLKMKYADDMKIVKTGLMETVFASSNSLANFERILPDSAYLQVKISDNFEHDKYKFYDNLNNYAKTLSDVKLREINKNGISGFLINGSVGQYSILDVYFFLPNNKMISFMGSYGHGFLQEELKEKIYLMATSFEFQASGGGIEKIVSDAREKIWVEGAGKKVLESFPEKLLIIETDSIGTGSGPVDYYYSSLGNVSIKYQRSNDMVLGIKEGKTSTF